MEILIFLLEFFFIFIFSVIYDGVDRGVEIGSGGNGWWMFCLLIIDQPNNDQKGYLCLMSALTFYN